MFDTGYDFFRDLLISYGKDMAVELANSYLDTQIKNKDPEEFAFCCELYKAVQQAKQAQ
jgi:hypothetical protein